MSTKVSVVVPVYNPGPHIDDCIASVLRQSLPTDQYEAIFVDDGSTDGTGTRLDSLAREHENVSVIHIPNSGWPGRPRNVGLDAAVGQYVYFVDHDDWIGDEALERLYDYAERNAADVVVGRVVGHGMGVPREVFRRNVEDASLDRDPLLALMTPHKLFRRAFLMQHAIRFPEGPRRLEDHLFVTKAYFNSRRTAILADYACYHWIKRTDAGNNSVRYSDPRGYYDNLREVLDVVDEYTEPGRARDWLYAQWYRRKGLRRLRGASWASTPSAYGLRVYEEVRRLAIERFGPGVDELLPARYRVLSRAVRAGRVDLVRAQARIELGMRADVGLALMEWSDWRLRLSLRGVLSYADGEPVMLRRRDGRIFWQAPPPLGEDPAILHEDLDVTDELCRSDLSIALRNRETGVAYDVPIEPRESIASGADDDLRIAFAAEAELDLRRVAIGSHLSAGVWDLAVHANVCGWTAVRRLPAVGRGGSESDLVAEPYTTQYGNVSITVKSPVALPAQQAARHSRPQTPLQKIGWAAGNRVFTMAPRPLKELAKRLLRARARA